MGGEAEGKKALASDLTSDWGASRGTKGDRQGKAEGAAAGGSHPLLRGSPVHALSYLAICPWTRHSSQHKPLGQTQGRDHVGTVSLSWKVLQSWYP